MAKSIEGTFPGSEIEWQVKSAELASDNKSIGFRNLARPNSSNVFY